MSLSHCIARNKLKRLPFLLLFLIVIQLPWVLEARWRSPKEVSEAQSRVHSVVDVKVNKQGLSKTHVISRIEVLTEHARNDLAIIRRRYNPSLMTYKIVSVKSVFNGKTKTVPASDITDLPIQNKLQGFDEIREIAIAVSRLEVGSTVVIEEEIIQQPVIPGHFKMRQSAGGYLTVEDWNLNIESELPLYTHINDSRNVLSLKSLQNKGKYIIQAKTKKPVFHSLADDGRWTEDKKWIWLEVGTHKEWAPLFKDFSNQWQRVMTAPLPAALKAMVQSAKKKKTPRAQINFLLEAIHKKINYVGDWRSVRGKYIPNELDKILERGFGDCKDYSAVTVRALREMGFTADPALIHAGTNPRAHHFELPSLGFNHAIVRAEFDETIYWLDPTQWPNLAQIIPSGIEDRQVLWLKTPDPQLTFTAKPLPRDSHSTFVAGLEITKSVLNFTQEFELRGRRYLRIKQLQKSIKDKKQLALYVLSELLGVERNRVKNLKLLAFQEIQSDPPSFKISLSYSQKNMFPLVGEFNVIKLLSGSAKDFDFSSEDRALWYLLPLPEIIETKFTLKGAQVTAKDSPSCNIESKWINAQRSSQSVGVQLLVNDRIERKVSSFDVEEFNDPDFVKVQKQLQACLLRAAVLVQPLENPI